MFILVRSAVGLMVTVVTILLTRTLLLHSPLSFLRLFTAGAGEVFVCGIVLGSMYVFTMISMYSISSCVRAFLFMAVLRL